MTNENVSTTLNVKSYDVVDVVCRRGYHNIQHIGLKSLFNDQFYCLNRTRKPTKQKVVRIDRECLTAIIACAMVGCPLSTLQRCGNGHVIFSALSSVSIRFYSGTSIKSSFHQQDSKNSSYITTLQ